MDETRAREVADAYLRGTGGQGCHARIALAAQAFLPDTDAWAIFGKTRQVLASHGNALYRLRERPEDQQTSIDAERLEVEAVRVTETVDQTNTRRRHWTFELVGADDLSVESKEFVGSDDDLDPRERLARALAQAVGWQVAS